MILLQLTTEQIPGAQAVVDYLNAVIEEEGTDRPVFATVAGHIATDIQESIEGTPKPHLHEQEPA